MTLSQRWCNTCKTMYFGKNAFYSYVIGQFVCLPCYHGLVSYWRNIRKI